MSRALRRLRATAIPPAAGLWLTAALWLAAIALLAVVVARHDLRADLTQTKRRTLAPQTIQVLKLLDRPIHVLGFFSDERAPRTQARLLMESYQEYTERLSFELADLNRRPELAEANGVTESGTLVLQSGDLKVKVSKLQEADLTGAIVRLISARPPRVLFLTGHGEASIEDTSPRGISKLADLVRRQNFTVQSFPLSGATRIPPEADAAVLAAPEGPMTQREQEALAAYVLRGGRLLAMVEPAGSADADSMLTLFGVSPDRTFVVDPSQARRNLAGGGSFRIALTQGGNPENPITRGFTGAVLFPLARSLSSVQPPPQGVAATRLVETAPQAWGETDFNDLVDGQPQFDPRSDRPGPLPLAFAVEIDLRRFLLHPGEEEKGLTGLVRTFYPDTFDARDTTLADTLVVGGQRFMAALPEKARMVVVGDVDFVDNANLLVRSNSDLLLGMLLWLTEQENRIALAPRPDSSEAVVLTRTQLRWVALLGIAVVPAIPLVLGGVMFWRRRRWL